MSIVQNEIGKKQGENKLLKNDRMLPMFLTFLLVFFS